MFNVPPFPFSPIALPCCNVGTQRCICCHCIRWSLTLSPAGSQQREPPDAEVGEAGGRWQIRLPRRGPACRSRREGGFSHGQRWAILLMLYGFLLLLLLLFFFAQIGSQMHTRKVVSCIHVQSVNLDVWGQRRQGESNPSRESVFCLLCGLQKPSNRIRSLIPLL